MHQYQPNFYGAQAPMYQPTPPPTFTQPRTNYALQGRLVNTERDVTPNEVPMDGTAGYFPAQDGSCIYAKAWASDGTISTVRYIPEQPTPVEQAPDKLDVIMERLDGIEAALKPKATKKKAAEDE